MAKKIGIALDELKNALNTSEVTKKQTALKAIECAEKNLEFILNLSPTTRVEFTVIVYSRRTNEGGVNIELKRKTTINGAKKLLADVENEFKSKNNETYPGVDKLYINLPNGGLFEIHGELFDKLFK